MVYKLSDFPTLAAVVKLPILAGFDFGRQASMVDRTVINLPIRGLELNIQNLELIYLLVNVGHFSVDQYFTQSRINESMTQFFYAIRNFDSNQLIARNEAVTRFYF